MSKVNPIPENARTVTPHLVIRGASEALAFYAKAFGAEELFRIPGPDGNGVMHGEMRIGDSLVYVVDEMPQMVKDFPSPQTAGGSAVGIHLYVEDCDAVFARALAAGAETVMPLQDTFWGDRYGILRDPFGHRWSIATHVRDVTPDDIAKAMAEFGDCSGQS